MPAIPADILSRLCQALLRCGPFATDDMLRAVFADARLNAWYQHLPQAHNPDERIRLAVDFLRNRYNAAEENALVLFLRVLSEQTSPNDACHQTLAQLADELAPMLSSTFVTVPRLSESKPYHNVPRPDYARFVGREKELDWMRRCLSPEDRAWQIAVTGIGGVGKSALALAIAHEYVERYAELSSEERFDAIIWISAKEEVLTAQGRELADLPDSVLRTLEDVYTAIARVLEREDITRALPEDQARLVERALKQQRTLLIMDNLESVKDERIKPFLRRLPAPTKAVITSREWLDVADVLSLTGLTWEEAEQFIVQEAAGRRVKLDEVQCRQIFQLTSGLPLPIRLAVGRLAGGESFDAVTRWLGDATGDLPEYCIRGQMELARERDPNAWRVALACALFERSVGASREALGYVVDLSLADRDRALANLQRLFLINRNDDDRFWVLPIVQRYVSVQLTDDGVRSKLVERWLGWLVMFAQSKGVELERNLRNRNVVAEEYPNLLSGIRWSRERGLWEVLFTLVQGAWYYAYMLGVFNEINEILDGATEASKQLDNDCWQAWVDNRLARLATHQGLYTQSLEYLARAERVLQTYGDDWALVKAWITHARTLFSMERWDESELLSQQVIKKSDEIGDLYSKIAICDVLSQIEMSRGCFDAAMYWLDKAEQWSIEANTPWELSGIYYRRGTNLIPRGEYATAEQYLLKALELNEIWGERRYLVYDNQQLVKIYMHTGRLQLARQIAQEARREFERLGMPVKLMEVEELLQQITELEVEEMEGNCCCNV